jgi:hypothetical protein
MDGAAYSARAVNYTHKMLIKLATDVNVVKQLFTCLDTTIG